MLQVITGKFYKPRDGWVQKTIEHQAVLYSNYDLDSPFHSFETLAGSVKGSSFSGDIKSLIYTIPYRYEKVEVEPGKIGPISHIPTRIDTIVHDFSAVLSFFLQAIFTPDLELAQRLTGDTTTLSTHHHPREYLQRFFDRQVPFDFADSSKVTAFFNHLLSLERKVYEKVIRAIRRYVNALHRMADDLEISYVMLVAALEALAQDHLPNPLEWSKYDQELQIRFDRELQDVDPEKADRIRSLVLTDKHLKLMHRFKTFIKDHIKPEFFREDAVGIHQPISATQLEQLLENAYSVRSKQVHDLQNLPREFTHKLLVSGEVFDVTDTPMMTLRGFSRLARHVILNYIHAQKAGEEEEFDSNAIDPHLLTLMPDSVYWLHHAEGFDVTRATYHLNTFLIEWAEVMTGKREAFTDLTPLMREINSQLKTASPRKSRHAQLLYMLFYQVVSSLAPEDFEAFLGRYLPDVQPGTLEHWLWAMVGRIHFDFDSNTMEKVASEYLRQRSHPRHKLRKHLTLPLDLETSFYLFTAECFREEGKWDQAQKWVGVATENQPGNPWLIGFEKEFDQHQEVPIPFQEFQLWVGQHDPSS